MLSRRNALAALALGLAGVAHAAEVRPGLGLGIGAFAALPSSPLVSPRFDVQVEGGTGYVAFFVAARFGTFFAAPGKLFAATLEAGARWHVTRNITLGLAIATGLAVFLIKGGGSLLMIGATLEPFTWCFNSHHEVGLTVTGMLPAQPPPAAAAGPYFSALLLPTVGYTYRF